MEAPASQPAACKHSSCEQLFTCCHHIKRSLVLSAQALMDADPLPAVQPGALPRLVELSITLLGQPQPIPLPPSWGSPSAWPSLRSLKVVAAVAAPLPASWGQGFRALQELVLHSNVASLAAPPTPPSAGGSEDPRLAPQPSAAPPSAPSPSGSRHTLPAEWARGFPSLQALTLGFLGLSGTFPAAWQASGSFPQLQDM